MSPTGRIRRDEPRLQNIPVRTEEGRRIREALVRSMPVVDTDYSQIEKRILAAYDNEGNSD
jgi:DNA polymerase-1